MSWLVSGRHLVLCLCGLFSINLLLSGCSKEGPPQLKVQVGQRFPDLQVRDLKNRPAVIEAATGKITLLNVWATWCAPCRHEMPSLDRLDNLLDESKYRVVGLSVDDDDHLVREFLIDRKVFFENYLDPRMKNAERLIGIRVYPSTFFIGPNGVLLKVVEGWKYWDSQEMMNEIKAYESLLRH
ncbi:TlpA family protein disulfide reductase [Kaarinaea lacus]